MTMTTDKRMQFVTRHWNDAMGWKSIPFWCVVASAGLFATRPTLYQVGMYAGGAALCWVWTRSMQGYLAARIGVVRRPATASTRGQWRGMLLTIVPCLLLQYLVGFALEGSPRQAPVGWSETHLSAMMGLWLFTMLQRVVDGSNPLERRCWYAAAALLWSAGIGAVGYAPLPYSLALLLFGMLQCATAVLDLWLLLRLDSAPADLTEVQLG